MTLTASGGLGLNIKDIFDNVTAMDWPTDSWKVALFTNTITTPNKDTNTAYGAAPFNANEVTGTGYTATGQAMAGKTLAVASGVLTFDANDTAWTASTFSAARGCLVYDTTITTPVTQPGLVFVTFGADFAVTGGTFTIVWNASGIATLSY